MDNESDRLTSFLTFLDPSDGAISDFTQGATLLNGINFAFLNVTSQLYDTASSKNQSLGVLILTDASKRLNPILDLEPVQVVGTTQDFNITIS